MGNLGVILDRNDNYKLESENSPFSGNLYKIYLLDTGLTCDTCSNSFTWSSVTSPWTGRDWMDRNIGACRIPNSKNDYMGYGSFYQWGRLSDGHECLFWKSNTNCTPRYGTTSTLSTTDTPGHSNFILSTSTPWDWRNPQNDNLWQGVYGTNNPCPSGYKIPDRGEWENEINNFSSADDDGAFASFLKLPSAGHRAYNTGYVLNSGGGYLAYWSSTPYSTIAWSVLWWTGGTLGMGISNRADGFCVRCIAEV